MGDTSEMTDCKLPLTQSMPVLETRLGASSKQPTGMSKSMVLTRRNKASGAAANELRLLPSPPAEVFGERCGTDAVLAALYDSVCGAMGEELYDFDAYRELHEVWDRSVESAKRVAERDKKGAEDDKKGGNDAQALAALAALALFTSAAERGCEGRSVHAVLNGVLRRTGADERQLGAWQPFLWFLVAGLRAQQPRVKQGEVAAVYRGMSNDEHADLVAHVGEVLVLERFLSTSVSEATARTFGRWVVRVRPNAPLPFVGAVSLCPQEREVLFEPGTAFLVRACDSGIELVEQKYAHHKWVLSSDSRGSRDRDDDDGQDDE